MRGPHALVYIQTDPNADPQTVERQKACVREHAALSRVTIGEMYIERGWGPYRPALRKLEEAVQQFSGDLLIFCDLTEPLQHASRLRRHIEDLFHRERLGAIYLDSTLYGQPVPTNAVNSLKRAAAYAWVLDANQIWENELNSQVERIQTYASQNGCQIVQVYSDVTTELWNERPGLEGLLRDAQNGQFEAVILVDRCGLLYEWCEEMNPAVLLSEIEVITLDPPSGGDA